MTRPERGHRAHQSWRESIQRDRSARPGSSGRRHTGSRACWLLRILRDMGLVTRRKAHKRADER